MYDVILSPGDLLSEANKEQNAVSMRDLLSVLFCNFLPLLLTSIPESLP